MIQREASAKEVGDRLRALRMALNLKPAEIADRLEMERTYWSRFEGGKRLIPVEFAIRVCAAFGVSLDFIYLGDLRVVHHDLAMKLQDLRQG